jgi:hypothetical protein
MRCINSKYTYPLHIFCIVQVHTILGKELHELLPDLLRGRSLDCAGETLNQQLIIAAHMCSRCSRMGVLARTSRAYGLQQLQSRLVRSGGAVAPLRLRRRRLDFYDIIIFIEDRPVEFSHASAAGSGVPVILTKEPLSERALSLSAN